MSNSSNTETVDVATHWLSLADAQDYESTWKNSSQVFQSAIEVDDWRKSLKAARSPLGEIQSRTIDNVEPMNNPAGAPDGDYMKLEFNSSFEKKETACETITLIREDDGQWRLAGYFIK